MKLFKYRRHWNKKRFKMPLNKGVTACVENISYTDVFPVEDNPLYNTCSNKLQAVTTV